MNYFFIGVDVSKDTLDVAVVDHEQNLLIPHFTVENNLTGFDEMLKRLSQLGNYEELWFCFEHTGAYQLLLAQQLHHKSIAYSQLPALEIKRSLGITRGKNDKIDAQRIAMYAATHKNKLKKSAPRLDNLQRISTLLSSRNFLTKSNTAMKNHLKSLLITNQSVEVEVLLGEKPELAPYETKN